MSNNQNGGIGFLGLLALVFITLKLTNVIDWSWWWILSPLWLPVAGFLWVFVILVVVRLLVGNKGMKK